MCIFDSLAKYAIDYHDYLSTCRSKWDECRRCYKWLSFIPLTLAHLLAASCVFLFIVGSTLCQTGDCFHSCGDACGYTVETLVDEHGNVLKRTTTDNGTYCKCIATCMKLAGFACILGGIGCLLASFIMLAFSCLYLYEKVNMEAPIEVFVLMEGEQYPKFLKRRKYMNRNKESDIIGKTGNVINGQLVYTGWILTTDKEWVHCNKMGKMVVKRYSQEEYDLENNTPPLNISIVEAVPEGIVIGSENIQTSNVASPTQQTMLTSSMSEKEKFAAKIKQQSSLKVNSVSAVTNIQPIGSVPEEKVPSDVEVSENVDDNSIQPPSQAYATLKQNDT